MLFVCGPVAAAPIYKCTGSDGNPIFSDTPCGTDARLQNPIIPGAKAIPGLTPIVPTRAPVAPVLQPADRSAPQVRGSINTVPQAPSPASADPATGTSKQDPTGLHCAITQYIQWIRAQPKVPDPDVKALKLQEIDDSCGSSLHLAHVQSGYEAALGNAAAVKPSGASSVAAAATAVRTKPATVRPAQHSETTSDGWPIAPDDHLASIKAIPQRDQIILEVRKTFRSDNPNEIAVMDLTTQKEYKWDVLQSALLELPATQFGAQAGWAARAGKLLYASQNSVHLVQRDGTATELHLQMPGKLQPLQGMTSYAISPDAKQLAYLLYTRDIGEKQPDGFGKLYMDLMVQQTRGSPPVSVWNDRAAVLRPAWRPDGTAIAHTDSDNNLVVSDLNGKTLWSLHPGAPHQNGSISDVIQEIHWDPSGRRLAFILGSPIQRLYVVDADGSAMKAVEFRTALGADHDPSVITFAWSVDGSKFAFRTEAGSKCNHLAVGYKFETGEFPCIHNWDLMTADVDGSHMSKAIPGPDYKFGELFWIQ